ncbi:MAG: biopolymer transporter ExbD [candidate division Zixibacteria bacterium]|nr:biopolymer transporter ExbD [candidate division Zixibacteria bacterium]
MGGAPVSDRPQKSSKGGGIRRPKRRLSIRIDMTPMVDIAFLLLIFYMVTTVFSMPQAMEVNLPPKDDTEEILKIKESNLLTIRVDEDNSFYWNIGRDLPIPMETDSLRSILVKENKANAKLSTLLIIHQDAKYSAMVDLLDEIDLIERSFNAVTAKELEVTLQEFNDSGHERATEFRAKKFSYRYAMAPWESSDTRRILKVLGGGE